MFTLKLYADMTSFEKAVYCRIYVLGYMESNVFNEEEEFVVR